MHPAEILINLYKAKQAGATDPFSSDGSNMCYYANDKCIGCPADGTCSFITSYLPTVDWETKLYRYCSEYIDYSYEELIEIFPEYQI